MLRGRQTQMQIQSNISCRLKYVCVVIWLYTSSHRNRRVGRHRHTHSNKQIKSSLCRHSERHVTVRLHVYSTGPEDRGMYGHEGRNAEGIASVSQIFYHRETPEIVLHVSRSHCIWKCLQAKNKEEFGNTGSIANCQTTLPEIFRRIFGIICGIYYFTFGCVCVFGHIPRFLA